MRTLAATESELTAAPGTDPGERRPPEPRESRWSSARTLTIVRRAAITVWALVLLYWFFRVGITFDRNTLLLYVCAGLFAASIGRRRTTHVLRDWLPFAAVLVVYDLSRGAADALGRPTEWHLQLDFDRRLFAGTEPTVWLQSHLKEPFPPWWEVGVSLVYVSYFLAPWAVAGVLWLRDRQAWRRFAIRFVTISFIGLAGFIAFPAAPPWAASQCTAAEVVGGPSDPPCIDAEVGTLTTGGMLGKVHPSHGGAAAYAERIGTRGWNKLGIPQAKALIDEGQAGSNQVAAVPSLHAAISGLMTVFFWPRVRRRWRPLLAAYSLAMAFSLVYSAEHYVFDILLGWLVTVVVSAGFTRWERRRADRSAGSGPSGAGEKPLAATDTLGGSLPGRPEMENRSAR
ncbi:phosphatase PAP2 family protein [Jatrophihabitans sp.]|uniref:phosphatase PAP2 family protein n=1 Tax=Jatrophihabitans sp. TaxID=1932789 RepID=UPI002CA325B1|nr:phosphatase PAP2 family protein [Jatrophihabitans sp.]